MLGHARPGYRPLCRRRTAVCRRAARCSGSISAPRPSASPPPIPTAGSPTGVETIARKTFTADAQRLLGLAAERKAVGFVLGLPLNMDGSEGPRAQSTRAFARNLRRLTDLPIALWDERLSTAAVERDLIAADASRTKRAAVIDQHAAVFILQGALDRLGRMRGR